MSVEAETGTNLDQTAALLPVKSPTGGGARRGSNAEWHPQKFRTFDKL